MRAVRSKDAIRRSIWTAMEREGVSRFPGAQGRIPNFANARAASERLSRHPAWKRAKTIFREAGKSSPDVTHVRVVKSGDTLPLLCKEVYGSAAHYLRVAHDNGLDDFRNLTPGRTLTFAPLTRDDDRSVT